jgi:prepilin-type N-terminal cleavage/methylation domain-containing protein
MIPDSFRRFPPRRAEGFTFVELLVVLLIVAILTAMAAMITRAITAGQKRSLTATRLATVDTALGQFVMLQKRLPCPADGTLASAAAAAGAETARDVANGCTAQQNGVVPWRVLGLSEVDATDGWDRRLTYRASPLLSADNGMDMSKCDPAGTQGGAIPRACNAACVSTDLTTCTPPLHFLGSKGFTIQTLGGTQVMVPPATGAAYVVISHGETGGGGYLTTGTLSTSTVTDGAEEQRNYASAAVQAYYVDDSIADASGAGHFDDIVSRPSVLSVINKAALGPRSH